MTHMQHRLSAMLMAVLLCPIAWVYGGANKQGQAFKGSAPAVSVRQGGDLAVANGQAEMVALDKGTHIPWTGDDRQKVQALFSRLKERRITIQPTFYQLLGKAAPAQRGQLVSRCQLFFDNVDTQEIANTCCLSSMIKNKKHVHSLLLSSDDSVRRVAKTPALKSVTSLFHNRGFPQAEEDTQAFIEWEIWWHGEGQARTLDRTLLRTFSSIFGSKGIPNKKAVDDYLKWDIWWQGEGRARTLDRKLLRAFSSMCSGKGLPDKEVVDNYLQLDVWWQGEGQARTLDRELLCTFSSMFNCRGLPDRKAVEDYLQWEIWWQETGQVRTLDRELLRTVSSMFNGRGLPDKKAVDDYLQLDVWWQGDGDTRTLDRKLLRVFSVIFNSRGLPDKKAVQDYLKLDVWWQGDGNTRTLDRGLLQGVSAMFHGRGSLDKKAVEKYLRWEFWWRGDGDARTLDRNLLRIFSSMFSHKGLPDKQAVDDYLNWDVWWQGEGQARILDQELLRAFSSMFSGRGLPDRKAVDDYLQLDVWWLGDGKGRTLDRELLRAFSSMCSGRGLPDKKAVEDYLQLDVWWLEDGKGRTLDRELLRTVSSMFNGRGLPDKKAVEDYLQLDVWWLEDGNGRTLDRELLRAFSSMFSGRGFPDKKAVEDYLQLDVFWKREGEVCVLDRELLRVFSSMFSGRGIPDKKVVEDYLQWDVWWQRAGQARTLDRELLRVFSSMFSRKGLPDKKAVEDYLQCPIWWHGEGAACTLDRKLLRTFSSMFNGKGLPDKLHTDGILQWLTGGERRHREAIKVMADLYSDAYTGCESLDLPDINKLRTAEQQLTALLLPDARGDTQENNILPLIKRVALYLANDRGARQLRWTDCKAWLREYPDSLSKTSLLWRLLFTLHYYGGQGVRDAVTLISGESVATKRFVLDALDSGQVLASVQYVLRAIEPREWRQYLFFTKGLQPQPDCQQWQTIKRYLGVLSPVFFHRECLRQFLTLIWPLSAADRERFVQPEAVNTLITLLPSVQVMRTLSKSLTTNELKTLFDTYLAYRLGQIDKGGLPILFKGLLLAQLPLFDRGVIPPGVLAQTHDQPEGVVIRVNPGVGVEDPVTLFIQVMAALMERLWDCEYTVDGPTLILWPHSATAPITFPIPSLVWHPDGVQIRHWTSAHLHRLYQAIECWQGPSREPTDPCDPAPYADSEGLVPDSLRVFLSGYDPQSESFGGHASGQSALPYSPALWLETMLRQSVLGQGDIDQLYTYRDQLTIDHVIDVLLRMDQGISPDTARLWYALLSEKHQQALRIHPPWLEVGDQAMEAVRDAEDILRDPSLDAWL